MPPSDMLDVFHFFFEEDSLSSGTAEHFEAKDSLRSTVYSSLYNVEYKYKANKTSTTDFSELDDPLDDFDEAPVPVDPFKKSNAVKPYTPATTFDPEAAKPFGSILDAPLG